MNQYWIIVDWTLCNKIQWNLNQNNTFIKHAIEKIVYGMVAIMSLSE